MDDKITAQQLKAALGGDLDELISEVVEAINKARPGKIIPESEEPVRDASAKFRQALYEKALELRQRQSESAFSPSADRTDADVAQ
jgi:hypothetical protein